MSDGTNTKYYELEAKLVEHVKTVDAELLRSKLATFIERRMSTDEVRETASFFEA